MASTEHQIPEAARQSYYRAALVVLRYLEERKPTDRRFGAQADARWEAFRGDLTTADRLDLLIRDADAEWPGALGARGVFGLRAVAEDNAFGSEWQPLDPVDAEELWRTVLAEPAPGTTEKALEACVRAWGLSLEPVEVGQIGPADKLVVAGPGAARSLLAAFSGGRDLAWEEQVTCLASPPAHRQLFACLAALINAKRSAKLVGSADQFETAPGGLKVIVSPDADPADRKRAQKLA